MNECRYCGYLYCGIGPCKPCSCDDSVVTPRGVQEFFEHLSVELPTSSAVWIKDANHRLLYLSSKTPNACNMQSWLGRKMSEIFPNEEIVYVWEQKEKMVLENNTTLSTVDEIPGALIGEHRPVRWVINWTSAVSMGMRAILGWGCGILNEKKPEPQSMRLAHFSATKGLLHMLTIGAFYAVVAMAVLIAGTGVSSIC